MPVPDAAPSGTMEIDRNQELLAGSGRACQPDARLDVTAGLQLKMEPCGRHPGFELRSLSEEKRVQHEITVRGVRGDGQVGGASVEVDGLSTGQDDGVAVGCEHGQRVKWDPPRSYVSRVEILMSPDIASAGHASA